MATPCPPGKTSEQSGLTSVDDCEDCPLGHWCTSGKSVECSVGTYNDELGAAGTLACTYCPEDATTREAGSTSLADCVCEKNFYASWTGANLTCETCPVGTNCSEIALTLATLPLSPGHWRAHADTADVRSCPGSLGVSGCKGCVGGECALNTSWCKPGLGGPYCQLCLDDGTYYSAADAECLACNVDGLPGMITGGAVIATLLVVGLLLSLIHI